MSRYPRISKELILQTSLNLLIRNGYASVTIKNIAKELHCSTQPISWHFGSMNGLREALLVRALQYVHEKYSFRTPNAFLSFYLTGKLHIDMALNTPHLFRFLYLGESGMQLNNLTSTIHYLDVTHPSTDTVEIAHSLNITLEKATYLTQSMILYTHGLSSLIATGAITDSIEVINNMFTNTSIQLLSLLGVSNETISNFLDTSIPSALSMLNNNKINS